MAQKSNFNDIISAETPTLVDFTASWCGPCKAMAPVLEELAGKLGQRARIIKIDVDQNPGLAQSLQIMGVPTFILYKKGEVKWRQSGMQSLQGLYQIIEREM
jgi:thioredoxin 1